ncbi:MAG: flagellar motor switch protein FliN [Fuerstiella sp.]
MSDTEDAQNQDAETGAGNESATSPAEGQNPAADVSAPNSGPAEVHPVEFQEATPRRSSVYSSLERFSDVRVAISVEIGRVTMNIGEMLQLGEGSVVELDRDLTEPVAVMAQGVQIASGEVVVINDRFAVRITEIADTGTPQPGSTPPPLEGAA